MKNTLRVQDALDTLDEMTIKYDGLDVAVIDKLTNMMHLADRYGLDWTDIVRTSTMHFNAERKAD
jgi:hypothetical protein